MPAPQTVAELCGLMVRSELFTQSALDQWLAKIASQQPMINKPNDLTDLAIREHVLTPFQAKLLLQGKWKNFFLGGKYKVLDHLGAGGMGTVFRCEHRHMRRQVAVKLLPPTKQDEASLLRFQREAQAVAMLNHSNIVRAYDIDQERGIHFIVMEYIAGASLQNIVESRGPLSIARTVNYITQAAYGLQHASEKGLVHRDVKPSNLMLDWSGTVKLLDLGLARFARVDDQFTPSFDPSAVLGTADYLAPEQARSPEVDVRADVYSLGAVVHFLLLGHPVFDGGSVTQKLIRHQREIPPLLHTLRTDVPKELSYVVARMLAKNPADRYVNPAAVSDALAPWLVDVDPPTEADMPLHRYVPQGDIETRAKHSTRTVLSPSSRSVLSLVVAEDRSRC